MRILKPKRTLFKVLRRPIYSKPSENRGDTVIVHGGAGDINDDIFEKKLLGVQIAAHEAFLALKETGNVIDAVERAIKIMEDDEIFNAGYGSYLNEKGEVEMDACIMDGEELSAGGVAATKYIRHPITLARLVMLKTKHVLLIGDGALRFAREQGMKIEPPGSMVSKRAKELWNRKATSISDGIDVGAVAMDKRGNFAAGTSSGGRCRKMPGRCGDSCAIGAGAYADNTSGAVSCSGHGETIAKVCMAYQIANSLPQMTALEAVQSHLMNVQLKFNCNAGAVSISKAGDIGIAFNTKRMAWAYQRGRILSYGINPDEYRETKI